MRRPASKSSALAGHFQQGALSEVGSFVAERFVEFVNDRPVFSLRFRHVSGYCDYTRATGASYAISLVRHAPRFAGYEICSADEYHAAMRKVCAEANVTDYYARKTRQKHYRALYPDQYRRRSSRRQAGRPAPAAKMPPVQTRLALDVPIELTRSRLEIMQVLWELFPWDHGYRGLAYTCNGRSRPKRFQSDLDWLARHGFLIRVGANYRATEKCDPLPPHRLCNVNEPDSLSSPAHDLGLKSKRTP